jgi:hypothetical protein
VKDASGGEAGKDWGRLPEKDLFGYDLSGKWAYANAEAAAVGGVQVYAGVYKEIRIKEGSFGYYTATMTGTYGGRVAYPSIFPALGMAKLYWYFRIIDLNSQRPNYIVAEYMIDNNDRDYLGSETVKTSFSATIKWYSYGNAGTRYGMEAYVLAYAEAWGIPDPTTYVQANAYYGGNVNTYWGIWYTSIDIQAPCPQPGCVLEGTPIMLADGSMVPVETLKRNTAIMGYNLEIGSLVTEKVTSNKRTVVDKVEVINNGLLTVTPTNQPIYARHDGVAGWVTDPQDLKVGWELLNPVTDEWIPITSIEFKEGSFAVYDLRATAPDNYIANGLLLDRKPVK